MYELVFPAALLLMPSIGFLVRRLTGGPGRHEATQPAWTARVRVATAALLVATIEGVVLIAVMRWNGPSWLKILGTVLVVSFGCVIMIKMILATGRLSKQPEGQSR